MGSCKLWHLHTSLSHTKFPSYNPKSSLVVVVYGMPLLVHGGTIYFDRLRPARETWIADRLIETSTGIKMIVSSTCHNLCPRTFPLLLLPIFTVYFVLFVIGKPKTPFPPKQKDGTEDVDCGGMQRKLEAYNHVLDQEMAATMRDGGKRRQQQFLIHCTWNSRREYTLRPALC